MNQDNSPLLRGKYSDDVEVRTMEVRAQGDADDLRVEGYAAVFNQETNLGFFREQIARGAFEDVMSDDVRLLLNHDGAPLARTTNQTLTLSVDEEGLRYEAILSDTTQGRDLYKMIQRGDITQSSFAFTIKGEEWDKETNTRTITKVGGCSTSRLSLTQRTRRRPYRLAQSSKRWLRKSTNRLLKSARKSSQTLTPKTKFQKCVTCAQTT